MKTKYGLVTVHITYVLLFIICVEKRACSNIHPFIVVFMSSINILALKIFYFINTNIILFSCQYINVYIFQISNVHIVSVLLISKHESRLKFSTKLSRRHFQRQHTTNNNVSKLKVLLTTTHTYIYVVLAFIKIFLLIFFIITSLH